MNRPLRKFVFCCLCLTVLGLAACASQPPQQPPSARAFTPTAMAYQFQPGDQIAIHVYKEPDLSGKFLVEPDGSINYPLLGRVDVLGKTTRQLEQSLAQFLSQGYIVAPDIRVAVSDYRPIFLTGEVKRPGQYPSRPGMTVQEAITLAGGPTRFASGKSYLQRAGSRPEDSYRVTQDTAVYPGDIISVEERLF